MKNQQGSSDRFYADLPIFEDFKGITEEKNFHDVPADWLVVVSDIKGSTKAIENGRYKEVNLLGASSIIAILNSVPGVEIPFVFGGDGASFVIPPSYRGFIEKALNGTKRMAINRFQMDLRIGVVPAPHVIEGGFNVRIAKMRVSPWGTLAMFSGGGLAYADKLIKDPDTSSNYEIKFDGGSSNYEEDQALFEGLECRWEPIQSRLGETLSLMVLAKGDDSNRNAKTYSNFIEAFREIYGTQKNYSPVDPNQMKITLDPGLLSHEAKVRTFNQNFLTQLVYPVFLFMSCILGRIIFKFGLRVGDLDGEDYLNTLTKNSDFQKFDDTLRMTVDSNPEQRKKLVNYLEARRSADDLYFGIHVSDSALMTCMVFDRKERHLHFVDGSSGGYALAAKQLKSQLAENSTRP